MPLAIPKDVRKLLEFGSGVGIAIGATDLEVVVARVRPTGVRVLDAWSSRASTGVPPRNGAANTAAS